MPRCKNIHHCTIFPQRRAHHNSAMQVAAVGLIVYAGYREFGSAGLLEKPTGGKRLASAGACPA
jgi:hypothetical protein